MNVAVKDVMTARVIWVRKDASFKEMATALREHRISAFPVLDEHDRVIGVVSQADLLAKVAALDSEPGVLSGILHHREQEKARGVTAGDLMTHPPVTAAPDDTVEHAARLMSERRLKRLPVVDANGHLVGIISRTDVLAVFDRSDQDIRKEIITDVIRNEFFADPKEFTVAVKDGVVTLSGVPETAELGRGLVQRISHVHGVVAVRDRLAYLPPDRGDVPFMSRPHFPTG
jgi:CBS-domain-containing membrane protein